MQDQDGSTIDAGLALGCSFCVGWGPGDQLVHLGNLCGPGMKKCVVIILLIQLHLYNECVPFGPHAGK